MIADVLSAADWWREAGVDTIIDEDPRNWLVASRPSAAAVSTPATPSTALDSLDDLVGLYRQDEMFGPVSGRLLPQGNAASGLMLLADQPEPNDTDAGQILSGGAGLLLDRMLAAIGRDRAAIYLATITPSRVPGGRVDPGRLSRWTEIARRHVEIAAPRALLLLGDAASRAFLGTSLVEARGKVHILNLGEAKVAAIATFHPRFLLQQPARKADAWRDLRMLLGELSQ